MQFSLTLGQPKPNAMKQLTSLSIVIAFIMGLAVTFDACKKEEEKSNQTPSCLITAPTNGQEIAKGETVTVSVNANDSDGSIVEVRFFVDGVGKSSANSFPYNYEWDTDIESIGSHILKATSIDNSGGSTSDEISVEIIQGGSAPIADFNADQTSGIVPLIVNFTDLSTNNPTSWQWDFGDGSTSNQQNPSHTYNNTGTYTVTLTTTNDYGSDTKTKVDYITSTNTGNYTDPRDGQTYKIVNIGSQTWFAENLNYETTDSWWYDNNSANGDIYGRLYLWDAAMTACPNGWHLPSDEEWKILEMHLGMSQSEADDTGWRGTDEGKKLKSISGWSSGNGTDAVGFTALPGGYRDKDGSFYLLGSYGHWWSATEYSYTSAWYRYLGYFTDEVYRYGCDAEDGISVRCVRDQK